MEALPHNYMYMPTKNGAHALLITKNGEVLLVQKGPRYTFDPHNAGKVGMFGGGIEKEETVEDALRRELREELEFDVANHVIYPLETFHKTEAEDGMECDVHVFTIHDVDPAPLTLHEGDHEDTDESAPPDHNENIIRGTAESLLARTDLTRITRLALEEYTQSMLAPQ